MITYEIVKAFFDMISYIKTRINMVTYIQGEGTLENIKNLCGDSATIFYNQSGVNINFDVKFDLQYRLSITVDIEDRYRELDYIWHKYETWENYNKNKMLEEIERI